MELILHIGTEKTGSSSFQWWAAHNRDALKDKGVFFSKALGERNHQAVYLYALGEVGPDDGFTRLNLRDPGAYEAFKDELPGTLRDEVAQARKAGCKTFLISCEHCQSRLVSLDHLHRLKALLEPHFDSIRILCVLRPQIDMGVSLLSTAARNTSPVTSQSLNAIRPSNPYFNFETMNGRWSAVFDAKSLTYLPYQRGPGLIDYVCAEHGLNAKNFAKAPRENTAFDAGTFAIVNTLKNLPESQQAALRPVLNPALDQLPTETGLKPDLAKAQAIQGRFEELNARLIDRRAELQPGDLDPDWNLYPETGNLDLLDASAPHDRHVAMLLRAMARQNAMLDLRRLVAEAEAAAAQSKDEIAAARLRSAEQVRQRVSQLGGEIPQLLLDRIARASA